MSEKIEIELADRVANLEAHAFRTDVTLGARDGWLARLDQQVRNLEAKCEELSQAVGRLELPTVEIPDNVRQMAEEFGKITEAELKASLDLLKSGRQQIPIPPAIQREVEEVIAERRGEQPTAKRREWWWARVHVSGEGYLSESKPGNPADGWEDFKVIRKPSEAEIEAAVEAAFEQYDNGSLWDETFGQTIRKLLGGEE